MKKNINRIGVAVASVGFLIIAGVAYAQTTATVKTFFAHGSHVASSRPIAGTVTSINGSANLILSVQASSTAAITNYTVTIGNARILKAGATSTVSNIQLNDKITVIGTVSGMNIAAKVIFDGVIPHTTGPPMGNMGGHAGSNTGRSFASSTRPFVRPAAFGTVSSIASGSSFALSERTKAGTTTITIDTDSGTTFREGTTTAGFSNLAVGNLVAVTGTTTSTDQILAGKVDIMAKMPFGKGDDGKAVPDGRQGKGLTGKGFAGHKMGWSKGMSKGSASSTPQ